MLIKPDSFPDMQTRPIFFIPQDEQLYIAFESIDQLTLKLDAQIATCIRQLSNKATS
jgi:hypothetical protein